MEILECFNYKKKIYLLAGILYLVIKDMQKISINNCFVTKLTQNVYEMKMLNLMLDFPNYECDFANTNINISSNLFIN